jgi:hypothetical protein
VGWYVDYVNIYACLPAQVALVPSALVTKQRFDLQTTQVITIENTGGLALDWSIQEAEASANGCDTPGDLPWLGVSAIGGTTQVGAHTAVSVTLASASLAPGEHKGSLCVASNDALHPKIQLPITLTVVGAPAAITLSASPASIEINDENAGFVLAAGNGLSTTITAQVNDVNGLPVPDQVVTFTTTLGQVTASATTDVAGSAQATMTPELQADTVVVTAQAGAVTKTLDIVVTDNRVRKLFVPVVSR